jgi:hypothetical protein
MQDSFSEDVPNLKGLIVANIKVGPSELNVDGVSFL